MTALGTALTPEWIVENTISTLANMMGICAEAHMRCGDLFKIDRSFEMMLENFHTLFDLWTHLFPNFEHGDPLVLFQPIAASLKQA